MDVRLDGQTAVITGGSRGIGLGMARSFARAGANVMLVARHEGVLDEAARTITADGGRAAYFVADVASPEDAQRCLATTISTFGSLDVLVNNAGINPHKGPVVDIDLAAAARTVDVNLNAALFWSSAAWHAGMSASGGSILNIAAISAVGVYRNAGWYGALKAALVHLTEQLAYELAPAVRVNAICPGIVVTTMSAANEEEFGASAAAPKPPSPEEVAKRIPLGRLGTTEDIASAALFLVSPAASWFTGSTLIVDGGLLTLPHGSP